MVLLRLLKNLILPQEIVTDPVICAVVLDILAKTVQGVRLHVHGGTSVRHTLLKVAMSLLALEWVLDEHLFGIAKSWRLFVSLFFLDKDPWYVQGMLSGVCVFVHVRVSSFVFSVRCPFYWLSSVH